MTKINNHSQDFQLDELLIRHLANAEAEIEVKEIGTFKNNLQAKILATKSTKGLNVLKILSKGILFAALILIVFVVGATVISYKDTETGIDDPANAQNQAQAPEIEAEFAETEELLGDIDKYLDFSDQEENSFSEIYFDL